MTQTYSHPRASSVTAITAHNARMLVAFGVTTIRNPGGDTEANAAYNERIRTGALIGPEQRAAGEILELELLEQPRGDEAAEEHAGHQAEVRKLAAIATRVHAVAFLLAAGKDRLWPDDL